MFRNFIKLRRFNLQNIVSFFAFFLLIVLSFVYYAPCNFCDYNSDHAIHVLMSYQFELPRDYYYWGQNRLGSFFPMISHVFCQILPFHPLIVCSIVQYLFLFIGFILIVKFIQNIYLRLAFMAILFLPMNQYYYLILIGHPYSSQLLCGAIFIWILIKLKDYTLTHKFDLSAFLIHTTLSLTAILFLLIGVWVSEFNAVLVIIPIVYLLLHRDLRKKAVSEIRNPFFILFLVITLLALVFAYLFYNYVKNSALLVADVEYNKFFIEKGSDILLNFYYFLEKAATSLFFKDTFVLANFYNWFLIILSAYIGTTIIKNWDKLKIRNYPFIFSLIVTITVSIVLLFLSSWNFRSKFDPKYFTPVYILYGLLLLLLLDQSIFKKNAKIIFSIVIIAFSVFYCYDFVIKKRAPGQFSQFGEFKKLPKGLLIGSYWDVYKISSFTPETLKAIPYDHFSVRNFFWRNQLFNTSNFYFLDNQDGNPGGLLKYMYQFGYLLEYTGKKYKCNSFNVYLYKKKNATPISHFKLKTAQNYYVTINQSSELLTANTLNEKEAEVFEVVYLRNGTALKASNGKFVSANFDLNGLVYANQDQAQDWENFYIIPIDKWKCNLLSYKGKFVSSDLRLDRKLIANPDKAMEWETFEIIPE